MLSFVLGICTDPGFCDELFVGHGTMKSLFGSIKGMSARRITSMPSTRHMGEQEDRINHYLL